MCFFCILFSSINDEKLRRKYCNKQITSRDNANVQSHDQEESKLISIIHTNSPTNTPRGFHISTWNPRGVFVGEFLQLQMKQTLSSVQKNPCITVIADKKIISLFCLSGVLCSPPQSSVQIK